jgi:nucleoid-associated protein YgaU
VTKETKIGLLVGLAFIILFAIILSEKGSSNKIQPPSTLTIAKAPGADDNPLGQGDEPLSRAGRLPVASDLPSPIQPADREPTNVALNATSSGQPIPADGDPISPLPASVVDRLNAPKISPSTVAEDTSPLETESMSLNQALAAALETPSETSSTPPVEDDVDPKTDRSRTSPSRNTRQADTSMKIMAVHTVQPGESLGKIAARYYGRSTPARVDAIFNANRDVLNSIHSVRAKDELKIPQLDVTQQIAFEPVSHFAPQEIPTNRSAARETEVRIPIPMDARAVPVADRSRAQRDAADATDAGRSDARPSDFRWYRVRTKDTLSRIAQRELGDEGRFVEIYLLNKDIIQNKNKIKPGMKIRLPLRKSGLGASTAALTLTAADEILP